MTATTVTAHPKHGSSHLWICIFLILISLSPTAKAQWTNASIEYRETVSMVIDETPVWNWMSGEEHVRHFQEISVSPDGSKVAFTVRLDFAQNKHIYVMDADGSDIIDITDTLPSTVLEQSAKDVSRLRWNDDGTRLFFFGIYYTDLYYYDVASGTTVLAVHGIASPDYRIPYSINAAGTQVTFKHNAGWNESLQRNIMGLFTASVGGSPENLVDIYNLPYETPNINQFRYLGAARTGNKAFFIWDQGHYGGNTTAQWMYDGTTTTQGDLSFSVWPDESLDNTLVSADGSRVLYENVLRINENPIAMGYIDTATGNYTPIAENGFTHQHLSYDGTKARIASGKNYHTVYTLDDMSMRDTGSYYFKMNIYDISDMTIDNRYYFILTSENNDTATHKISKVDMAPDSFDAAPQVHSISFSAPALYHGDDSRIKVQAEISDAQGLYNIEWVVLVPIVEGRESPDWPMGRVPLAFPSGDLGSVYLYDDGTWGDTTIGDGIFTFSQVATRKGGYDDMNTWFNQYELPAEVGIRIIVKDVDGNYGISDTNLLITDVVPAAPDANFSCRTEEPGLPISVQFTDTSTGNISNWEWDFGDGTIGYGATAEHTYTDNESYDVTLTVTGPGGTDTYTIFGAVSNGGVAVEEDTPLAYALDTPYPNPFNPRTTIGFTLPEQLATTLSVYDIRGARIATLVNETMSTGHHSVVWDGRHSDGSPASSGVYIVKLDTGIMTDHARVLLVK